MTKDGEITGWYYLHTNGSLIHKHEMGDTAADLRESDFVRAMWPVIPSDRGSAWRILVEGMAAGANKEDTDRLVKLWRCDDNDAKVYADLLELTVAVDGNKWVVYKKDFVNLQESPAGFGDTVLEAFADLALHLGYSPAKTWGNSFEGLCKMRTKQ